jgi:uncharacterized protein YbjT (DUF2867 family)
MRVLVTGATGNVGRLEPARTFAQWARDHAGDLRP